MLKTVLCSLPDAPENAVHSAAFPVQGQPEKILASALQDEISSASRVCSIATDERGVIQIFNAGAQRLLGFSAGDVVHKMMVTDIFDPQALMVRAAALSLEFKTAIAPGFEALVFKAVRSIEEIYPLACICKDGSRFAATVSVTALRNAQVGIIGYLLIATDDTAHKPAAENPAQTPTHASNAEGSVMHDTAIFYDRDHKLQAIYTAAINVTERKKAQTQLFESEARLRAILAAAVDAIIIIDAIGTIESLNTATEKLFGYTAQEMVGQNVKLLMPASYQAEHDDCLTNYITTGVKKVIGIGGEVVGKRKNGETFPMGIDVSEVQTGGRRLFTGIVRDMSERNRIERALQEKNIELERANRMKSEFLATMSHELRAPLNAIIGFSEALKDGLIGPMTETQVEYIGDIFTSGQHLLSLINDILDLSKVEAGMMTLELEATDLKSLLSNSLSIVKEKAAAQRISLELEADDDLGVPFMDTRKIKQIIYNLLSNAVKFSASGARVVLSASRVPRSSVGKLKGQWPIYGFPLANNEHSQFLELCVSDRGIGISEANMDKLFIAFSQIDSSLARRFEGTGLGLAMVKQLTELQGGTVAVASEEGMGASFVAWLPLRDSDV